MSEQDNIRTVEKWVEALNAHDVSQLEKYRAPGYSFVVPDFPGPVGVDEETAYTQGLFDAFSDFHIKVAQTIAQGDFVVCNVIVTGTHDGPMALPTGDAVPPTGKKGAFSASNTLEFADGKIVRNSLYYDQLGMMAQLGLMPGM